MRILLIADRPKRLLVALAIGSTALAHAADAPTWTWHEPATEIYGPAFSRDGKELALVRMRHLPDGHEAEEIPAAELKRAFDQIKTNPRLADPEVVVLTIGQPRATRIDWGWSPSFSPDGRAIAYASQVRPISGLRVLAATMAGNDIRVFDRESKKSKVVASPASGYLADPEFTADGRQVLYSLGDAVNGAWGGNVGVGLVATDGSGNAILYPATKDHDLFHLVRAKLQVGDRVFVLREKPMTGGIYMANEYEAELLELEPTPRSIYTWNADTSARRDRDLGSTSDGELLVYDGGWRVVSKPATIAPLPDSEGPGSLSPSGELVATAGPKGVVVRNLRTGVVVTSLHVASEVRAIAWSPDATKIALVTTHYKPKSDEMFAYDEVAIFRLPHK